MTIDQIKADQNFLSSLELPDYNIGIYLIFAGSNNPNYYVFYKGKLLFHGNDFKASPLYGIDSLETICSLCGFITIKMGDVDKDYFKYYTKQQLAFTETTDCERLAFLLSDYGDCSTEGEANQYRLFAKDTLEKGFTN